MSKLILNSSQYMFDGSNTVTIGDGIVITKENLMLVTNTTTNEILYNFGCEGFGGTLVGQILTLERTATDGTATDSLQIILEQTTEETAASDPIIQVQLENSTNLVSNTDLLRDIKAELKKMNMHLAMITGANELEIENED